jgi:phosphoglycolate phosphatase-like HAD superfamily hydrolase
LPLLHAAKFFGVNPKDAMMLGDSISDVKASRAAGFGIICMSYGYNSHACHCPNSDKHYRLIALYVRVLD